MMTQETQPQADAPDGGSGGKDSVPSHEQLEEYGGGHIKARHGRVNGWLLGVYAILFVWSIYYGFVYWGGLGPGLDY
ncbi:MAG: hypothetical protein HQ483_00775 [Rhodospirillales bacterium]|nr:hypothetical protein [Rhodospirillales bacterium]